MKKLIAILIIFCLLCGLLIGGLVKIIFNFHQKNKLANSQGEFTLPEVTLTKLDDQKIKFHTLKQPTVLFFWLPQSESCQLQLNILSKINQNYDLKIIGVGIGAIDQSEFETIKQEKEIKFPLTIDNKTSLTQKLNITTIPTLVFYKPTTTPKTLTGFKSKTELETLISNYFSPN